MMDNKEIGPWFEHKSYDPHLWTGITLAFFIIDWKIPDDKQGMNLPEVMVAG